MKAAITLLLFFTDYSWGSFSHWDYDHMKEWSNEYSMCGALDESPIDIEPYSAVFDHDVCDSTFEWDIDLTKQTFKVSNNGHTISLKPVQQTNIDPDQELSESILGHDDNEYITLTENENTIGTLPNYFKPAASPHSTFCLDSIHFHWGLSDATGSEHLVDGNQYPLEVHFVHYSCEHATLGSTLEQFPTKESVNEAVEDGVDTHQLGVVGIFFDVVEDRTNAAFDAIFDNETLDHIIFPESDDGIAQHHAEIVMDLNLADLIPDNIYSAGYYAYEGSLTTPPCTDIVRWHVMNARGYIGVSQIEQLRSLMSTEEYPIAPNYREVQDNVNVVYSCVGVADLQFEEEEVKESLSWWAVAIISSLVTAVVMGIVFIFIYKKQEREINSSVSANETKQIKDVKYTNSAI